MLATLRLSYWTLGTLNEKADNAILLCHGASGSKDWALPYSRPGGAFDPEKYFLISVDMPGGGDSSRLKTDAAFPAHYAIGDMSNACIALLDALGIRRLHAFSGASMATLIGLDLASRYPQRIGGLALWTAGYRTDGFARTLIATLGRVLALDQSMSGFRAAVGAFLPALGGRQGIASMAEPDIENMLGEFARDWFKSWQARELTARYLTLGECDLASAHGGVPQLAASIRCPLLMLQSSSDMIFNCAEAQAFAAQVADASLQVVESDHGHVAPFSHPGSAEFAFFDTSTAAFMARLAA